MVRTSDLQCPGAQKFSLLQASIVSPYFKRTIFPGVCVLLTSPSLKIGAIGTLTETVTYCSCNFQGAL